MGNKKCEVEFVEITEKDIKAIRNAQQNKSTPNYRPDGETAFSKALNGSKIFLYQNGYINELEE